jgi:hypothetical protein
MRKFTKPRRLKRFFRRRDTFSRFLARYFPENSFLNFWRNSVKLFNRQAHSRSIISLLLFGLLCAAAACDASNLAGRKDMSAARSENQAPQTDAVNVSASSNQSPPAENAAPEIEGTYVLNDHRAGQDGHENSLIVEKEVKGKIRVAFEGTFFYRVDGAETFRESSAYGTLTLNGNVARGRLKEEGSENSCAIELNFSANGRVNLNSESCDLRVTPDGVYKKGAPNTENNLDADVVEKNRRQNSDDENDPNRPFVQYDQSGEPNGIVNLMQRDGERVGCEEDVMNYVGEVKKVDYIGDYVYEFTLASDNRKPQKISLALSAEDRLPFDDVRSIIRRGNHLEVTFIYCGNGGIATPTAIFKR